MNKNVVLFDIIIEYILELLLMLMIAINFLLKNYIFNEIIVKLSSFLIDKKVVQKQILLNLIITSLKHLFVGVIQ